MALAHRGAPLGAARAAVVMLHGRNSTSDDILALTQYLELPGLAFLAPQAEGGGWYPQRFMMSLALNEPWLSLSLQVVWDCVAQSGLAQSGLAQHRVALLGFSQGACLALEAAYRRGGRFGAVIALSGGLIGADSEVGQLKGANLAGTPVLIGCADNDFHIPLGRVNQSESLLTLAGAHVDKRIYPKAGHSINADEIKASRDLLRSVLSAP